jgi:hypothetical protein
LNIHPILQKVLSFYLNKWYVPVFVAGLLGFLGLICLSIHSEIIAYLSLGIPFFALLASGILGVIKVSKKRFVSGVLQIVLTALLGFGGLSIVALLFSILPL